MNKEELINAISVDTSFSKTDSRKFLDSFLRIVPEALSNGESIQLVGFATISVADRAARKGRNPQTGKEISIPASKVVKFSAGKQLKETVNNSKKKVTKKK